MKNIFALLFILAGVFILSSTLWLANVYKPVNPSQSVKNEFIISPGETLNQIGQRLQDQGLIRSLTAFKLVIWRLNLSQKIRAGYTYLSPSQNLEEIAISLTKSTSKQVWITIPEGLRRQEIAHILSSAFNTSNSRFDATKFIELTPNLEGKLFPDTYAFTPATTTEEAISRLNGRFQDIISQLNLSPSDDVEKIIIIASILEREAASTEEMPIIAGIINNRLNSRWPLQIDATVQYALASQNCKNLDCQWWPRPLSLSDLKLKSPFNTYLNPGLPPSAISNPGKLALAAAAQPTTTTYWFYLHDNEGKIHYATTSQEHARNVCQYLKKDCR